MTRLRRCVRTIATIGLLGVPLMPAWAAGLLLNQNATATEIAQALDGPGLSLNNLVVRRGVQGQYGTFSGGAESVGTGPVIGIPGGVFMSTGTASAIIGHNTSGKTSITTGVTYADPDLTQLSSQAVYDPVLIEFDIVPVGDKVNFVLVFGSEEYPEYVCSQFNDAFGLFVSGKGLAGVQNAAFLPNSTHSITVNNVNAGQPGVYQDGSACLLSNAMFFNDNGNGTGNANTQLDGFTKPLTAALQGLTPGATYHVKLALADAADAAFDSAAFFKWLTSTVSRPIDMELTASASTLQPRQYEPFTVTYTLHNRSSALAGELLQTQLQWPTGWKVLSHNGGNAYNPTTAVWEAGTVPANGTQSITFTVQAETAGNALAQAEILYALHDDIDSTPFNSQTFPEEDDTARLSFVVAEVPTVALQVKALLQGAYQSSTGLMHDALRVKKLIPLQQPYHSPSLFNYQGKEATTAEWLAVAGQDAPVDWVLVELRDKASPKNVVARAAGLLQRDGDVANPLSNETVLRLPVAAGDYYVSVRHRNHLGVMIQAPVTLSATPSVVDFTQPATAVAGQHARLLRADGKALLWAGDANASNSLIGVGAGNDANAILGTILQSSTNSAGNSNYRLTGYDTADLNMDGLTVYSGPENDTNLLLGNIAQYPANSTGAANYMINGTLPK